MQTSKENSTTTLMELDIGNSTESFQRFLASQKELFHSQIDQLQQIVVTQCKLTGANPLSQEMAAAALSINIGKRPRDLLNPKAVKYMQSVFSIKDTISKKESREISALHGVTVTQVREFFAGQRSRVRKFVRLSRDKAIKSDSCRASQDGCSTSSDPTVQVIDQAPLNSVDPKTVEEAPSCSSKEETIPDMDESDKSFFENIFTLMKKEVTFSGQVKLMEWILQIQNSSVLLWFLTKGGVMILAAWLSQAVLEEQTTVLLVILKVLCHLPLHKVLPVQMSAILQSVNRLRFYRTSDISNRAKVLLSRWSKLFVRSQSLKKPSFTNSPNDDAQKEKIFGQSEMLSDEWLSKVDLSDETFALSIESSENCRKTEPSQALKQLPASAGDSNKKQYRGVSTPQTRERRKVLLVEQPGQNTTGRSLKIARVMPSNQGRPMSADDIQKAKMRALFMQSKYGKTGASSNESPPQKIEVPNKSSTFRANHLRSASKTSIRPKIEEDKKPAVLASETSTVVEVGMDSKPSSGPQEPSWEEKLKRDQIPWRVPPEIRINSPWKVSAGEKSKEVEFQTGRILREKETIYQRIQDIPSDPREPWDLEMDCDDTLTPEIPIEQPPDADSAETSSSPRHSENAANTSIAAPALVNNENVPEPDLELLAVLLKNPELVFALTSGQGSNLTSAETVRLLDMIKASGIGLPGVLNRVEGNTKVEVASIWSPTSLPSPTPPSERIMNGQRAEVVKDSHLQQVSMANREDIFRQVTTRTLTSNFTLIPSPATISLTQQHPIIHHTMSQMSVERRPQAINLTTNQSQPTTNQLQQNILAAGLPSLQPEPSSFRQQMQNVKPAPLSIVINTPKDRLPSLPTPLRPSPPILPEPPLLQPLNPAHQWNTVGTGRQTQTWAQNNQDYNVFPRGPMFPPLLAHPHLERNEYVGEPEFEMWSPERSPERPLENWSGRNFSEPRRDYGRNSRPDHWSRRDSGRRDDRHGSRRWRDRRH